MLIAKLYTLTSDGSRSLDRIITTLYIFKYIMDHHAKIFSNEFH